ncbi:MAG: hypothetical protein K0R54_3099 [Clostridiaceae bacterium]|jgi:ABC-2 type transport system permease protein|nr:hypothetical protein [Clostridiaceae bacterium]
MKILQVAVKEIKQNLRDRKGMAMMILFPILLMLVLGSALSGGFNNTISLKDTKVLYSISGSGQGKDYFINFTDTMKKSGIQFQQTDNINRDLDSIKDTTYACLINVDTKNNVIDLYENEKYDFKASIVKVVLNTYVQRYNLISQVAKEKPMEVKNIIADNTANYVSVESIDKRITPSALDYYAITMLTMIIMYSSLSGSFSIGGEYKNKTAYRLLSTPISKFEILTGKAIGNILSAIIQVIAVIIFSKFVLKAYYGNHILQFLILLLSEIIMAVAIGMSVSFIFKRQSISTIILNMFIPLMVFFGGGYGPLDGMGNSLLTSFSKLSPIKWTNDTAFALIYGNGSSNLNISILINIGIAAAFLIISSTLFIKEME